MNIKFIRIISIIIKGYQRRLSVFERIKSFRLKKIEHCIRSIDCVTCVKSPNLVIDKLNFRVFEMHIIYLINIYRIKKNNIFII